METFTQMRNRLMEVHGWCRRVATLATRYYKGVEGPDDFQARTQERHATLSLAEAHEIVKWR